MPKKKSKVLFKHIQRSCKKKPITTSIAKQNEHSKHDIGKNILSPVNDGREHHLDQSNEIELNNDSITKEKASNLNKEHPDQINSRHDTNQEGKITEKNNIKQYCCDSNSLIVPTKIRNQPGLQLVMDLYRSKENGDNNNIVEDNNDNLLMVEHTDSQNEVRYEKTD